MSLRFDRAELGAVTRTPQGGIKAPAALTRTGVFEYLNPDGSIRREYRAPEEVFSETHLKSIAGAPVTMGHPKTQMVTASTWRGLTVGHAGETIQRADQLIEAYLYIQDATAIDRVMSGESTEISLGYDQTYIPEPGVSPEGLPYDGRQTNLVCNHIALVPRGRAGRDVGLRLDSEGNQMSCATLEIVQITIAGTEYEAGSPEAIKALADLEARATRTDALERKVLEHMRAKVREFGVETRADSDMQTVMMDALKKLAPGVALEGMSDEWLAGAFAVALSMALDLKSEPEPTAESPAPEPSAAGAAEARADVLDARHKSSKAEAPSVPRDVQARMNMISKGRAMRVVGGVK